MAQLNFDQLNNNNTGNTKSFPVGFFNLKNDNEEAVVRFMHDSTSDFDILTVHPVNINGKFRDVNCIRENPRDPMDNCPMCKAGTEVRQKFFIKVIQYTKQPDGSILAEPKIWKRSFSYAQKLKGYIDNYGPLSDILCKIVRHGAPGNMDTTYDIIPRLNPEIYSDNLYPKKSELFEGYNVLGTMVMDKTYGDMMEFVNTGNFPVIQTKQQSVQPQQTTQVYQQPVQQFQQPVNQGYVPQAPQQINYQPAFNSSKAPWQTDAEDLFGSDPVMDRPKRTY